MRARERVGLVQWRALNVLATAGPDGAPVCRVDATVGVVNFSAKHPGILASLLGHGMVRHACLVGGHPIGAMCLVAITETGLDMRLDKRGREALRKARQAAA